MAKAETMDMAKMDREVGAAFIASGVGSLVLGILVILVDASAKINSGLVLVKPVGALSGKTTIAVAAFLVSWAVAYFVLKGRAVKLATSFYIALVLIAIGALFTFPPVFELIVPVFKPIFGA